MWRSTDQTTKRISSPSELPSSALRTSQGEQSRKSADSTPAGDAAEPRAEAERHEERAERSGARDEQPQRRREAVAQERERRREEHRQRLPRRPADGVEIEVHDLASPDDPGPRVVGRSGRLQQRQRGDREARDRPATRSPSAGTVGTSTRGRGSRNIAAQRTRRPDGSTLRARRWITSSSPSSVCWWRSPACRSSPARSHVPYPIALVVGGLAVGFVPGDRRDQPGPGPRPADLPAAAALRRRLLLQPARAQGQRAVDRLARRRARLRHDRGGRGDRA